MNTRKTTHNKKQNFNWIFAGAMLCVLGTASVSPAVEGIWTEKAPMSARRVGHAVTVANGKVYVIGGNLEPHDPGLTTVEEYDPATDTWTTKAPIPTPRMFFAIGAVDGIVYAIGGGTSGSGPGISTVEAYDPTTDTWTAKADMPTARKFLCASVADGKIYVIGGRLVAGAPGLSIVEEYDPATDTWTNRAPMPTPRFWLATSVVDGIIYAIGGALRAGVVVSTVEAYDPVTDTWTTKAPMPTERTLLAASTVDGRIYAVGGGNNTLTALSTVEVYDPVTDIWTQKAGMPAATVALATFAVDAKINAIGGAPTWGATGTSTVYEYDATPILVVDFNGDGIIDSKDVSIMVDNWHTDNALYDIAPTPFGDGIVDVQDLIVLSEYLLKEVDDPTLVARWALDETEGDIALDSAGENFGLVVGSPVWQPTGGQVNGAIQLDGVDDVIIAGPPLNPADGPFSVFAWVQGGAAGQAVISEPAGPDWLSLDPLTGHLMTELTSAGRGATPLQSQAFIIDENWHRIGLVWDGLYRTLYVDGIAVAEDTQDGLANPANGFYIGTGKAMATGTFFSGLIDDVRIYNRAVSP